MIERRRGLIGPAFPGTLLVAVLAAAGVKGAEPLPIERLAQVTFTGAELEKTRTFYRDVMGFAEVHPPKDSAGQARAVYFKINDDQFLAFVAGAPEGSPFRLTRISFQAPEIRQAREWVVAQKVAAGPVETRDDGNLHFTVDDPDGTAVDFVEYQAGSWQANLRGKDLGPHRVTQRLQHAGLVVANETAAMAFYREKLGFWERNRGGPPATPGEIRWIVMMMPGPNADYRRDFIEFMVHAAEPPERRQHLCFAVPDLERAHQALVQRPGLEQKFKPFTSASGLHLMNIRDPNGMRLEFWEVKPN